jgi:hypothetical protein
VPRLPALDIALDRMNSDNETPHDLAVSKSMSRSCGKKRMATRAVRCRDSERRRGEAWRRNRALLTATGLSALAEMLMERIRSCNPGGRYNRVGVSRRLYRFGMRPSAVVSRSALVPVHHGDWPGSED